MRHQCLLVACLIGSVFASPVPSRAVPIIGVVVPTDLPAIPKFAMGDSIERAAPSPVSPSVTSVTTAVPSTTLATSTSTASDVALKPGNRYQVYGNVSTNPTSPAPVAEKGEAVSRSRPAKKPSTVQKRDEDEVEVVVECVEYEDGVMECTDPSVADIVKRNDMKRKLDE